MLALFLALVLLPKLIGALRLWGDAEAPAGRSPERPAGHSTGTSAVVAARRRFPQGMGGAVVVAATAGTAAVRVRSTQVLVTEQRATIRLPRAEAPVGR